MTAKQREATDVLLRLREGMEIEDDEFYLLLDFIIKEKETIYIPSYTPYYYTNYTSTDRLQYPEYQITC